MWSFPHLRTGTSAHVAGKAERTSQIRTLNYSLLTSYTCWTKEIQPMKSLFREWDTSIRNWQCPLSKLILNRNKALQMKHSKSLDLQLQSLITEKWLLGLEQHQRIHSISIPMWDHILLIFTLLVLSSIIVEPDSLQCRDICIKDWSSSWRVTSNKVSFSFPIVNKRRSLLSIYKHWLPVMISLRNSWRFLFQKSKR